MGITNNLDDESHNNMEERGWIVAVTIARIESDIIESYVRYTLTYADEIIIYDNDSSDGTREILQELYNEGLPLVILRELGNVEFNHAEIMTKLCFMAVERNATLVVPIDVDEFLINTENNMSVRDILLQIPRDCVAAVPLVNYRLAEDYYTDKFLLREKCYREHLPLPNEKIHVPKSIIGSKVVKKGFSLAQGGHFVQVLDRQLKSKRCPYLHLAHFHYRSEARYQVKSILGWLGTVCKYGENTVICEYMKYNYYQLMEGEEREKQFFLVSNADTKERIDLASFCMDIQIQYGNLVKNDVLPTVMKAALRLANSYAMNKSIAVGKQVDVLVPYWGDREALNIALRCVGWQDYPQCRVKILCLEKQLQDEFLVNNFPCEIVSFSNRNDRVKVLQGVTGDFVQWIFPYVSIPKRHILSLLTTVEMNGYNWRLCIHQRDKGIIGKKGNHWGNRRRESKPFNVQDFWQAIMSSMQIPAAGLRDVLIPRKLLCVACDYFADAFEEKEVDYLRMWEGLLTVEYGNVPMEQYVIVFFQSEDDDSYEDAKEQAYKLVARENKKSIQLNKELQRIWM